MKKVALLFSTVLLPYTIYGGLAELCPKKIAAAFNAGVLHTIDEAPDLSKPDTSKLYIAYTAGVKTDNLRCPSAYSSLETDKDVKRFIATYGTELFTDNGADIVWYCLDNSSGEYSFKKLLVVL